MALTHSAIRSRVHRAFAYWRPIVGLESWQIDVLWDECHDTATCQAKPAYEEATLHFNLPEMKRKLPNTYAAVEELTLHELVHCLMWRESERNVSRITRALLRAHGRI
jgi:hypothetical protein